MFATILVAFVTVEFMLFILCWVWAWLTDVDGESFFKGVVGLAAANLVVLALCWVIGFGYLWYKLIWFILNSAATAG